jgi:hypothetical protein
MGTSEGTKDGAMVEKSVGDVEMTVDGPDMGV